jgi:hypothetical protein
MSTTILNALAAQLGEETMAAAYIESIQANNNTALINRLERQTRSATTGTLNDLGGVIHEAAEAGLTATEAYIDAVSRLDALMAVLEGQAQ